MNNLRRQINLGKSPVEMQRYFAYKDPYVVGGGPSYFLKNRFSSYRAQRSLETEFVDFKSYQIDKQFKDINQSLYRAYERKDMVNLMRSLSDSMYHYTMARKNAGKINPFLKHVSRVQSLQTRVYGDDEGLEEDDDWAQITVMLRGTPAEDKSVNMYTILERRVADKLDYFDWKISYMAEEEDFKKFCQNARLQEENELLEAAKQQNDNFGENSSEVGHK